MLWYYDVLINMDTINKRYKFRIYPNKIQQDFLVKSMNAARFVYNEMLAITKVQYELKKHNPQVDLDRTGYDFHRYLPIMKHLHPWLSDVSHMVLQQSLIDLGSAFSNLYRALDNNNKIVPVPKFKKKGSRQTIRLVCDKFRIQDNKLFIAKCKSLIKVNWSRELPSIPSSCTISRNNSGDFYVSFIVQVDPHLTYGTKQTGIDLGITDFAILSDGERIANNHFLVSALKSLKRAQQSLSRKVKGSKNKEKVRIKVAKLYQKISNQRDDFLHKLSRRLVNENQVLGMESLQVKNMLKLRALARSISELGLATFSDYISYKAKESQHCSVFLMDTFYPSSKLCSHCGTKYEGLKLSERTWTCVACNTTHDRDLNAALNIKAKALSTFKNLSPTGTWIPEVVMCSRD